MLSHHLVNREAFGMPHKVSRSLEIALNLIENWHYHFHIDRNKIETIHTFSYKSWSTG